MKHDSTDLRVKRTLKCIRDAFYELIMTKNFNQISITELTEKADINRKTFYLHYTSLDDLVDEIEAEMVQELLEKIEGTADSLDVATCINIFYHYLDEGDIVQKKLLCDPDFYFFYNKVTNDVLNSDFFQHFYEITEHPHLVRAYCVAITSIFRTWYSDGRKIPLQQVIDYSSKLLLDGYNGIDKHM